MPSAPDPGDLFCRCLSAGAGGAMLGGTIVPPLGGPVAVGIVVGLVSGVAWAWWSVARKKAGSDPAADGPDPTADPLTVAGRAQEPEPRQPVGEVTATLLPDASDDLPRDPA